MKKGMIAKAAGSGLTVGANESLGALMPPIINTMLLDAAAETAIIRPRCSTFALSGAMELTFPKVKGYDRSGGLVHGGMVAYWRGENQLLKESKFELEDIRLNLSALTVLAFASHRVMRFAPVDVGAFLLPKMGDAITFKEEDAFLNGSGVGMPLGILKSPSKVTIAKEANQAAASIVTANVDKMISRIRIERAMSTVFLYNRADMYPLLVNLTRTIGTSGVLSMLYVPGANGTGTLSGFPAVNNDHCQALGTEGDLVLADWSQYLIADDRQGPETAQSMHLKFDYGQEAFRIIKYVDGQSVNSQAYTPHRGTNTTSGIITLAARG
jgi:HK97 family phage major capsid protein